MYQLTKNEDVILHVESGAHIPRGHRFWDDYEQWLADGGVPLDKDYGVDLRGIESGKVRSERDKLLREFYDVGMSMLNRLLRSAAASEKPAINAKIAELDSYALALQEVPEQAGFPFDITWPTQPSATLQDKEL